MSRRLKASWILPIGLAVVNVCLAGLNVTYEWKYVDYVWKSSAQKARAVAEGEYDLSNIIIQDVQPLADGRVLVTTPRYFDNPASLSVISDKFGDGGPLLAPYPDWSWHTLENCSGITSVNKVILDDYDRLWLVDSGKIGNEPICSAKILIFDAKKDKLLLSLEIPNELWYNTDSDTEGLLEILAVESSCNLHKDTWVYVSDVEGFGALVSNLSHIWRLDDDIFKPNPNHSLFSIAGNNFTLNIGTSGVLFPEGYLDEPYLLFKPLSSVVGHAVSLNDLHNSWSPSYQVTFWTTDFTEPSQETARTFTTDGILIAAFPTELTIACWNTENPLQEEYIGMLETNETIYQFVSTIKNLDGTVYVTSNKLQEYILGIMDFGEVNYRVMTGDIATLVDGTVCEPSTTWNVTSIEEKAFHLYNGIS